MEDKIYQMYYIDNIKVCNIVKDLKICKSRFYDILQKNNWKPKGNIIDKISKKELIKLYFDKNIQLDDIAKKYDITIQWLYKILDRFNIDRRRIINLNKHITKKNMIEVYNESRNYREAAKKLGVTLSWFSRHMKKFGLKPRTYLERKIYREKYGFVKIVRNVKSTVDADGRKGIYIPSHPRAIGLYVANAILVKEKEIGRGIRKGEIVHHKNFDCCDDRPENLLICSRSEHSTIHGRKW